MTRTHRAALPDALRAIALVSVLVMNAIGYTMGPWGHQLGVRTPVDSTAAAVAQGLAAALLQGKGFAMLAFVFGMSLWLSARNRRRADALQRGIERHRRLLQLGVAHGVFVYFGDILTLYSLVGRRLLARLHDPWKKFRKHLLKSLAWAVAAKLVMAAVYLLPSPRSGEVQSSFANVQGLVEFLQLNAGAYVFGQIAAVLIAGPLVNFCMLAGVATARLKLLTHRRWRAAMKRYLKVSAPVLMPLTLLYGWACAVSEPTATYRPWIDSAGDLLSVPIASVYLVALGLASSGGKARWCAQLAPLGQRTLTLYVGHSVVCVALFSGIGLALAPTTVQIVLFCIALWSAAWVAAMFSGSKRWPLEAWMARRSKYRSS